MVNVTELIKRECIKSSFCGIFISLKGPFSNADHKTLLEKLGLYGIQEKGEIFFSKKEAPQRKGTTHSKLPSCFFDKENILKICPKNLINEELRLT